HSFSYDTSYRVSSNTQGTRGTIGYTYDAADRIATYSVSGGPSATYTYYSDGSLKNIQWSAVAGQFDYTYVLRGPYNKITFPNGLNRTYTYDDQSRITKVRTLTATGSGVGTFIYAYDVDQYTGQSTMLGQRSLLTMSVQSMSISSKQFKYYYDGNYQLNRVDYPDIPAFNSEIHSWTYDDIGNRLTNTVNSSTQNYNYYKNGSNPLNGQRLQSDGTKTYTYDNNGNVTGDGTYTYTWDYENRLTGVTGGGLTTSYSYDYLGRRKSKTVNGVTTTHLYDGQNLIREMSATNLEYVFGPGIDEPLAQDNGGAIKYYVTDALGTTVLFRDSNTNQNEYIYDAWGVLKSQTGTFANPFTYTAREAGEAGLMFYRARYYNPNVGRFVSEDPEWNPILSLDPNPYSYARNSSTQWTDPNGLYSKKGFGGSGLSVFVDLAMIRLEQKLREDPCCAGGPGSPGGGGRRILSDMRDPNLVIELKLDLEVCGYAPFLTVIGKKKVIQISPKAFTSVCCDLSSTLLHEISHIGMGGEDQAYKKEKDCFGCEDPRKSNKPK
ncbi:hypothetical protein L0222_31580, partial [bacterium]|nr:hypothetical protein [bacterium]